MEEIDIWRTARLLIKEHGSDARTQAINFAAKMLEHRNYEGYAVWGMVWSAIKVLQQQAEHEPN